MHTNVTAFTAFVSMHTEFATLEYSSQICKSYYGSCYMSGCILCTLAGHAYTHLRHIDYENFRVDSVLKCFIISFEWNNPHVSWL